MALFLIQLCRQPSTVFFCRPRMSFSVRISEKSTQTVDMADAATPEDWQVVKLRIWARQWRASKLAPKVYGERIDAKISGALSLSALVAQSFKLDAPAPALTIEGRAEDETDT